MVGRPGVNVVAPPGPAPMPGPPSNMSSVQREPETQSCIHGRTRRQTIYGLGRRCPRYDGTGKVCGSIAGGCILLSLLLIATISQFIC